MRKDESGEWTGTVLVVEDEPVVAGLVKQALESEGYQVLVARNGAAALRLFRKGGDEVDLILTDVYMPVMNGPELVTRVQENRPELPVLFMSGYTDDVLERTGIDESDIPLVHKPFEIAKIARVIRERLAEDRGHRAAAMAS